MIPQVIAIDGHSSTGKSSLSLKVAKALGFIHVDTGAMYRAISLLALENNLAEDGKVTDRQKLIDLLADIELDFNPNAETGLNEIHLNGRNVEKQIRSMEVSNLVSDVSRIKEVREFLVKNQRSIAGKKGIVMDGRDIGTVVFPDAPVKIFLTASAEVRAKRRFDELKAKGVEITLEEVQKNVNERDHIDSTRAESPLRAAEDAVLINNDHLDREQTFEAVMKVIREKLGV